MYLRLILLFVGGFVLHVAVAQTFTRVTRGLELGGSKDGGAVWADFDNDGDIDVAVSTDAVTRLYQNDGADPPNFTDVTTTLADGMLDNSAERSLLWADLNNDGNVDLLRNTSTRLEIYINRGTSSTPNYMFGVGAAMTPNLTWRELDGPTNMEGMGVLDYDNDGWLDIVLDNTNNFEMLRNGQQDATATVNITWNDGGDNDGRVENDPEALNNIFFPQVTTGATGLGINGPHGGSSDYLAVGDFDNDGYLDFAGRTNNSMDKLFRNTGSDAFTAITDLTGTSTIAENGNKGGVIFCDFDLDGDLDIFWTDAGTNQIWLQTTSGNFTATAKPTVPGGSNIDGCACADVDLDGDLDLFLGNNGVNSYLYINTTTSPNSVANLSFTRTDINVNDNAEAVNLVDYDNDGDYDIYVNVDNDPNQLWENDLCDGGGCSYLKVFVQECLDGSATTRPVVGASIVIRDDMGDIVAQAQSGSTAAGHGAQNPPSTVFGLPDMVSDYTIDIIFPEKNGTVETYSYDFNASVIVDNELILTSINGTSGGTCDSVLPVVLAEFSGAKVPDGISLAWRTISEVENDRFEIERSSNGEAWDVIGIVEGFGTSEGTRYYSFEDVNPLPGINYYRLKQVDFDGSFEYHPSIAVLFDSDGQGITVYPNPSEGVVFVDLGDQFSRSPFELEVLDVSGRSVRSLSYGPLQSVLRLELNLQPGIYQIIASNQFGKSIRQVLIR
ncbi:MAG: FG-GAP-like repeat-containing protein [Bacteroidota bacterium]